MSGCNEDLRAAGKAYPRTCAECGLFGPCRKVAASPPPPHTEAPAAASDEREAFEAWMRRHDSDPWLEQIPEGQEGAGDYFGDMTSIAWRAWQERAARAPQAAAEGRRDCGEYGHPDACGNASCSRPAPQPTAQADAASVWRKAVQEAYGWLWHVNNEPMAPAPLWSPEKAAYEARKNLRELLTMDERGEAINAVRGMLENMAAANSAPAGEGEKR